MRKLEVIKKINNLNVKNKVAKIEENIHLILDMQINIKND